MAKKDFSKVNTNPLYGALEDATADIIPGQLEIKSINMETQEAAVVHTAQEKQQKARKTYNSDEEAAALESMQTSGKKGCKLPRINMAFTPANKEFIKTMANVRGETMTEFVNHVLDISREANADLYNKALEFRRNLK